MRKHLLQGLTALSILVGLAFAYASNKAAPSKWRGEIPSLEDELTRVHIEQDLMLAERTAKMLDEFQEALEDWDDTTASTGSPGSRGSTGGSEAGQ